MNNPKRGGKCKIDNGLEEESNWFIGSKLNIFCPTLAFKTRKQDPQRLKITCQNWKFKQSKTLKKRLYIKVCDLESAKYSSVKNNQLEFNNDFKS